MDSSKENLAACNVSDVCPLNSRPLACFPGFMTPPPTPPTSSGWVDGQTTGVKVSDKTRVGDSARTTRSYGSSTEPRVRRGSDTSMGRGGGGTPSHSSGGGVPARGDTRGAEPRRWRRPQQRVRGAHGAGRSRGTSSGSGGTFVALNSSSSLLFAASRQRRGACSSFNGWALTGLPQHLANHAVRPARRTVAAAATAATAATAQRHAAATRE